MKRKERKRGERKWIQEGWEGRQGAGWHPCSTLSSESWKGLVHTLFPSSNFSTQSFKPQWLFKGALFSERSIQHSAVTRVDRAVGRVLHFHCRRSPEKPFVFFQMVINNALLQVFKSPETITFYSFPPQIIENYQPGMTFGLACPFLSTPIFN